jgi:AraC-like DNA-binding protein
MFEPFKFEERGLDRRSPGKLFIKDERAGEKVRIHYHQSLEINLFNGIDGAIHLEAGEFSLKGIRAAVLPPRQLHGYSIEPGGSILVGHIAPDLLDDVLRTEKIAALLDRYAGPRFFESFPAHPLLTLPPDASPLMLTDFHAAELLFFLLARCGEERRSEPEAVMDRRESEALKGIIDLVEEGFHRKLTLEKAARTVGVSRSRFCRFFKAVTGLTFHRFLLEVRLENARSMLLEGQSVTAAAADCGFFDASHLIRHYRSRFGVLPGKAGSVKKNWK